MPLNSKQKQRLKALAHPLKPIILIGGNGLTPAVQNEIDLALNHHELIKIRIQSEDRDARKAIFEEICATQKADLVQTLGRIGVFYRKNPEK
jgi:RNA-binding protein